jgi:hypothetical protein
VARVQNVSGPSSAAAGQQVVYRVSAFDHPNPPAAERSKVSWLIKTPGGAALTHLSRSGPELRLTIPDSWAGQTAIVMPYVNAPSAAVAVNTAIAPLNGDLPILPPKSPRRVEVMTQGGRYYASVDGEPRFYLGADVRYGDRRGLMNSSNPPGPRYRPEEYEAEHGDWAWYLFPTIVCESKGHFTCLNTYDRAAFTFGHIQLGAHTPNDNFVSFFREILAEPSAMEYFPDLTLDGGRICCRTDRGLSPLESPDATTELMNYFNATPKEVDHAEADRAARLVDWSLRHKRVRDIQVAFSVREQKRKLATHAKKLPLDGVTDKLCIVVLDILHQGRGRYPAIRAALLADDPFDALLAIGASQYRERIATLRAGIKDLEAAGRVGRNVYDAESDRFVVPSGA